MGRHVARRALISVPIVFLASIIVFLLVALSGDPLRNYRQPGVPASSLRLEAHALGLDHPLWDRYLIWLGHVLQGNFGRNTLGQPVGHELWERSLISLRLIAVGVTGALVLAVVFGFLAAVRHRRITDRALGVIAILCLTFPEFWTAVLVKQGAITLDDHLGHPVLKTFGDSTPGGVAGGFWPTLDDYASHLVLPSIVLVLAAFPIWFLYQRSSMLDVLGSDYVEYARAKGVRHRKVLVKHGLRTALIPLVTVVALRLPWILGGLVVIETVFGWQGLGDMIINGIQEQDENVVLAWLLFMSIAIIVLNLLADLCYGVLDPRVRNE